MPQLEITTFLTQYLWLSLSLLAFIVIVHTSFIPKLIKSMKIQETLVSLEQDKEPVKPKTSVLSKKLWEKL
uniref:ATP synthase F0 subunit 8 n=1 Tax=Carybdea xaymacana TaxID=168719 RepID=G9IT61_9CNID|nr:ATP synthase F0 subunit 8 [Carybdea xaymacana]